MSEGAADPEPEPRPDPPPDTEPLADAKAVEPPETIEARKRSRQLLWFSLVLFVIGAVGLVGLDIVKMRDQSRRRRRDRDAARAAASAASAASAAGSTAPAPTPLPAWTPNRRP